jgi:hypothetical protein
VLWCLLPQTEGCPVFALEFLRQRFIELHQPDTRDDHFGLFFQELATITSESDIALKLQLMKRAAEKRLENLRMLNQKMNPYIDRRALGRLRL